MLRAAEFRQFWSFAFCKVVDQNSTPLKCAEKWAHDMKFYGIYDSEKIVKIGQQLSKL